MIQVEVWLYGPLARYAGDQSKGSHAQLRPRLPEGATMADLLQTLRIPPEEKGITFVNADLADMPGMGADLDMELKEGDRIGIFHRQSMWPFQYRFGAAVSLGLKDAMRQRQEGTLYHSPTEPKAP